ncbi:hypothetical protein CEXT_743371 [Caerostris extrusa]|uniref:Uncharacterized protein n=1 Tax=Caerostris extrusa TaxID=172846 RepID=A0AAV4VVB9_CAEEX|nr:hypothetical protein CEXT_743371 [Caerostris extrusa]
MQLLPPPFPLVKWGGGGLEHCIAGTVYLTDRLPFVHKLVCAFGCPRRISRGKFCNILCSILIVTAITFQLHEWHPFLSMEMDGLEISPGIATSMPGIDFSMGDPGFSPSPRDMTRKNSRRRLFSGDCNLLQFFAVLPPFCYI